MKKLLAATASGLALMISCAAIPARAADLSARMVLPPPIAAVPVFTWTGFYVGANLGAVRDASELTLTANPGTFNNGPFPPGLLTDADFAFMADRAREHKTSFTGGGQIGYNYQAGSFVFGVEADINFSDVQNRRDRADPIPATFAGGALPLPPLTYNARLHSDVDWFGTVRARAGATVDRVLIYATGGLAYGHVKTNVAAFPSPGDALATFFPGLVDINQVRDSDTRFGWTIGGGVEYALTNNLTLKGEYLYVDLGDKRHIAPAVEPAIFSGSTMAAVEETKFHVIRAGMNFKFNTW